MCERGAPDGEGSGAHGTLRTDVAWISVKKKFLSLCFFVLFSTVLPPLTAESIVIKDDSMNGARKICIFLLFLVASALGALRLLKKSSFPLQCLNSEAAYTTLRELQLHRAVFLDPNGFVKDGDLLNHIERELCEVCYQQETNPVVTVCQEYLCSERTGSDLKRANCYAISV